MAHDPVLVENTTAWLRKAGQDLRRVERCLADEPPDVEDALFHCQQTAEKAPKAFLTWHDQPFKKTHDLAALGTASAAESLCRRYASFIQEYSWRRIAAFTAWRCVERYDATRRARWSSIGSVSFWKRRAGYR
jgi:HEPN domain-containing protein